MKKSRLNGCVNNFSVDYKTFNTSDIIEKMWYSDINEKT